MNVTQRGELSGSEQQRLLSVLKDWQETEDVRAEVRAVIASYVGKSSYREVSRLTGFSTNTLQRWVREAAR